MSAEASHTDNTHENGSASKKIKEDAESSKAIATAEVEKCVQAFKEGKPIMVFDSAFRECETDLLWPATAATPLVSDHYM